MVADGTAIHPTDPQPPAASVPDQSRRCVPLSPADRIVRQVRAIDAWVAARRQREQALHAPGLNRDQRMEVAREVEALRRTHDVIKGRCARGLDAEIELLGSSGSLTAVIAHRHAWFVDRLGLLLGEHGVTVLFCTDNGAEALGAVVADQPDLVIAGDRLAMVPGRVLLAEARVFSQSSLLVAQASDPDEAVSLRAADSVFLHHHSPAVIADALLALHLPTTETSSERSSRA